DLFTFQDRHKSAQVKKGDLSCYSGNVFLGVDAGSTTTKMVLIGENDEVLYSYYEKNKGNPVETAREGLVNIYKFMPKEVKIARSTVTGYGEKLIQAAFLIDDGEIETVAHYQAAKKFQPDVDFILDIGGQDMKCIKIKEGVIDGIILNEACSAGCGSFLENFAQNLGMCIQDFSMLALTAESPVELGSRCTVFMNSKVKQVQKEGASIADISAGLSYSVIMNALYKVIKMKSMDEMGERIVVQGGTFLNDAVLRAFEKLTGKDVIRPDLAGLMGAYGSALIAKKRWMNETNSTILGSEMLDKFQVTSTHRRCGICENHCPITINRFADKRTFITGNRCERGEGKQKQKSALPNLVEEKLDRLFSRVCVTGVRGKIGIPRVLNLFENYPFWHRFFTELGFEVVLSDPSSKEIFENGIETIPSESVCYPAKLSHGHIMNLLEKGLKTIFYPAVIFEKYENQSLQNHFNCPIVASYPEVIRANMAKILEEKEIRFLYPFLSFDNDPSLIKELSLCFEGISKLEIKQAIKKARQEEADLRRWIQQRGEEVLAQLQRENIKGIIVAGHPYHIDPAINHGLTEEINKLGMAVLTEDSICHLAKDSQSLNVVNQWTYHSRLYRAAEVVKMYPQLEMLQVTSFGCGLDAITTDAVEAILEGEHQLYTWIKMDEISNLGAARIRIRSLKAAIEERDKQVGIRTRDISINVDEPIFTKEAKEIYTILAPQMVPTHFTLFEKVFQNHGYRLKVLTEVNEQEIEEGLRFVNNDACYPAVVSIGQLLAALKKGDYDINRTAVIMSQTGGGCRATNYFALLKNAMKNAGMSQVPVLSLNSGALTGDTQPGFKISLSLAKMLVIAACLGDLLMRLQLAVRPYEFVKGQSQVLYDLWLERCHVLLCDFSMKKYKKLIQDMIDDFSRIEISSSKKPRVGVVGEILVKFHPYANNQLVELIEQEGGEAVVPDFLDFFLYCLFDRGFNAAHFGKSKMNALIGKVTTKFIEFYRTPIREALADSKRFGTPIEFNRLAEKASQFLSLGNQMGEGWLLPGEIAELMESGVENVICVQPFGCLPNHIVGRGMFNSIKKVYPNANLISIDYDSSISKVNQVNRIKLMINIAKNKIPI
ncbi:MAG TPA: acyl-CoA dehydratase activase-related protein, partial [Bacillales bacterium]|nr:acyl-CoA dehydratase activase-related protein [Bacillales bacterium]